MNRGVMQRQMFAGGGAAGLRPIPQGNMGLPNLPEGVRNNMGYMAMGGSVPPMMPPPQGIMSAAPMGMRPQMPPQMMANGGSPMMEPPMMGAPMPPPPSPEMMANEGAQMMDQNALAGMLGEAEQAGFSDPEQAGSLEEMMNSVSGEQKSPEERRNDLASIVGPEDAGQTPESVLALVTPVVQIALVDQGIGPMAQEQMNTPVEGDMGGGIMSMAANGNMGVGNEPPVNFNLGGEVRRRGDEDPVPVFEQGGPVQYFAPENPERVAGSGFTPMTNFGDLSTGLQTDYENLLPLFEKNMNVTDAETRKNQLQSDILFDIAGAALAFSGPMKGEKAGLTGVQRLAMAADQTKLLPTIGARISLSRKEAAKEAQAPKSAAMAASVAVMNTKAAAIVKERNTILEGGIKGAAAKVKAVALVKENTSARSHKEKLEGLRASLVLTRDSILNSNKVNAQKDANAFTILIKGLDQDIALTSKEVDQENELIRINLKSEKKITEIGFGDEKLKENLQIKQNYEIVNQAEKHINDMSKQADGQVFDLKKLNIVQVFSGKQAQAQIKATKENSDQKNATSVAINDNNLVFKNKTLKFNKDLEKNKQSQLKIANEFTESKVELEWGKLDLATVINERQKAENAAELALKNNQFDEVQVQNIRIAAFKEREADLQDRKLQFQEIDAQIKNAQGQEKNDLQASKQALDNSFKREDMIFRQQVQNDLKFYRSETTRVAQENTDLTRAKNLFEISNKKAKLALEKAALTNEQFGKNVKGVYTSVLNNAGNLAKYAKGDLDADTTLMINNAISYFSKPQTSWSNEAGRYVSRPPLGLGPDILAAVEKRTSNGFSTVDVSKLRPSKEVNEKSYITEVGDVNYTEIANKVKATLMTDNINPDQATGMDNAISKVMLPFAGLFQSVGWRKTGYFTKDQAGVKDANKAFEALALRVNNVARAGVSGRLFASDIKQLQDFTKALKGGTFTSDVSLYDSMIGTRNFLGAKYKLAVEVMENPQDYTKKQVTDARKDSTEFLSIITELQTGILLFEKALPGLNPNYTEKKATTDNEESGDGTIVGLTKKRG